MLHFLFSFTGRTGRLGYFGFWFAWLAIFFVTGFLGFLAPTMLFPIIIIGLMIAAFISGLAITVRRLHDINLSGWTYILALITPWIALIIIGFAIGAAEMTVAENPTLNLAALLISLHQFLFSVVLSLWPGTDGENRFG